MRNAMKVVLDDGQEFLHDFDGSEAMGHEDGRRWLDQEFVRMDCEPLRASGKVLIVDKVMSVAKAAGAAGFADADWFTQYAAASIGALARPSVVVDTRKMTVDC